LAIDPLETEWVVRQLTNLAKQLPADSPARTVLVQARRELLSLLPTNEATIPMTRKVAA
jgi:hypothetical protein